MVVNHRSSNIKPGDSFWFPADECHFKKVTFDIIQFTLNVL